MSAPDGPSQTRTPAAALPTTRLDRTLDVLVWGATGFTGRLVAERLARSYGVGRDLRWAIGGRDRAKLQALRSDLEAIDPRASELGLLVGDSHDRAALDAIAREARVVASTVGPYGLYGKDLVAACAGAGTDYCDLCGEVPFIREIIDLYDARARVTGARIVPCCGYDSIPSDLGTLMLQSYARDLVGGPCAEVRYFAAASKGGVSGGTIASALYVMEQAGRDPRVRKLLGDPYALDPPGAPPGPDGPDQRGVRWDADLGGWTGPFVMAAINTRVVRRTNALLGHTYGTAFRYLEATSFRAGAKGWLKAAAVTAGTGVFSGAAAVAPVRKLLQRTVLPAPGQGPSKAARESGFFVSRLVGLGAGPSRRTLCGSVRGTSDPGYGETAKMLAESAVCLALDGEAIRREGGVSTPAACMGMRLVERLRAAGMTFEAGASGEDR